MDRGSRQTRKDRIAAVEARQNEGGDRHYCSLDGKMLPDRANSAKLVVTGFGGLSVMKFFMDSVLSMRTPRLSFDGVRGGNRVHIFDDDGVAAAK